jgi:Flp pilus assembly protein TadB
MEPIKSSGMFDKRYWAKVGKGAFLIGSLYVIGISFWWTAAATSFRDREIARDVRYHQGVEKVEAALAATTKRGTRTRNSNEHYKKAQMELNSLVNSIQTETERDLNGEEAIGLSLYAGAALVSIFVIGAALNCWIPLKRA